MGNHTLLFIMNIGEGRQRLFQQNDARELTCYR